MNPYSPPPGGLMMIYRGRIHLKNHRKKNKSKSLLWDGSEIREKTSWDGAKTL